MWSRDPQPQPPWERVGNAASGAGPQTHCPQTLGAGPVQESLRSTQFLQGGGRAGALSNESGFSYLFPAFSQNPPQVCLPPKSEREPWEGPPAPRPLSARVYVRDRPPTGLKCVGLRAAPSPWNSLCLSPRDPVRALGDPRRWAQKAFPPEGRRSPSRHVDQGIAGGSDTSTLPPRTVLPTLSLAAALPFRPLQAGPHVD